MTRSRLLPRAQLSRVERRVGIAPRAIATIAHSARGDQIRTTDRRLVARHRLDALRSRAVQKRAAETRSRGTSREEKSHAKKRAGPHLCQELSMPSEKKVLHCHRGSSSDSDVIRRRVSRLARLAAIALLGSAVSVSCAPPIDRTDDNGD